MEIGIFSSHIIWRLRHRKVRKEAKETGKSIEEILEGKEENPDAATQDRIIATEDLESQRTSEQVPPIDSKEDSFR